jgi:hypothetical protein
MLVPKLVETGEHTAAAGALLGRLAEAAREVLNPLLVKCRPPRQRLHIGRGCSEVYTGFGSKAACAPRC